MVLQSEFESAHDLPEFTSGLNVFHAGRRVAGGVIVRQDQATCVQVEGTPHGAAQRQFASRLPRADVNVLGDEKSFASQEDHHDAFLTPAQQTAGEVLTKSGSGEADRLSKQSLAQGDGGEIPGGDDHCGNGLPIEPRAPDLIGQRLRGSGIDRAERSEPADQAACNDLAPLSDDGAEDLRQDG